MAVTDIGQFFHLVHLGYESCLTSFPNCPSPLYLTLHSQNPLYILWTTPAFKVQAVWLHLSNVQLAVLLTHLLYFDCRIQKQAALERRFVIFKLPRCLVVTIHLTTKGSKWVTSFLMYSLMVLRQVFFGEMPRGLASSFRLKRNVFLSSETPSTLGNCFSRLARLSWTAVGEAMQVPARCFLKNLHFFLICLVENHLR